MEVRPADHVGQLSCDGKTDTPQVTSLRECLLELFEDLDDIQAIQLSGKLIAYCRDTMLPGLGAVRRNATANARMYKSPDQIASETGLSYATVSRLITESRGVATR